MLSSVSRCVLKEIGENERYNRATSSASCPDTFLITDDFSNDYQRYMAYIARTSCCIYMACSLDSSLDFQDNFDDVSKISRETLLRYILITSMIFREKTDMSITKIFSCAMHKRLWISDI